MFVFVWFVYQEASSGIAPSFGWKKETRISPGRKFRAENQTPVSMAMHGALGVAVKANQRLSHV